MSKLETLLDPTIKTGAPDHKAILILTAFMAQEAQAGLYLQAHKIKEKALQEGGPMPLGPEVLIEKLCQMSPEMWFSYWCVIGMGVLCTRPAIGTLWAHTLITYQRRHDERLTVNKWLSASGFTLPQKDEYERLWIAQKAQGAPSSNLLDDPRSYR